MPKSMKPQLATQIERSAPRRWRVDARDQARRLSYDRDGRWRQGLGCWTRTGIDRTDKYGVLAENFAALPGKQAILDGEIVVVDESRVTHFSDLQQALSDHASERLTFFAFDLMYLDGYDLTKARLDARKALLQSVLAPVISGASAIQYSDGLSGDGQVALRAGNGTRSRRHRQQA